MSKDHKVPFDYLRKSGARSSRRDYVETDYVNGVKDADGREVIRPMTKEEREWLSQYYREAENVSFNKTDEIKTEQRKLRKLIKEHRDFKEENGTEHPKVLTQRSKLKTLREESNSFFLDPKEHKELYKQDNDRANDLFNVAKQTGALVNFDISEYDKFTSEAIECTDGEMAGLNQMFKVKKVRKK